MHTPLRLSLLGLPWDGSSSFQAGAALAPPRIREALWSPSTNSSTELGVAVTPDTLEDAGDVPMPSDAALARLAIEGAVERLRRAGIVPCVLGGDHSVTYPVARALSGAGPVTILHIDAHGDLYDEFPAFAPDGASARLRPDGASARLPPEADLPRPRPAGDPARLVPVPGRTDRYSHACPFARIMEEGLCRRLVQVGVRTMTPHLLAQAARFGVEVHGPDACGTVPVERLEGPLYVSLDLDGLDPAFAPGVAHPEPGGLSVRDVIRLVHRIRAPLVGFDVVEYNPLNDVGDLTARVAAKLLKELVAVTVRNGAPTA